MILSRWLDARASHTHERWVSRSIGASPESSVVHWIVPGSHNTGVYASRAHTSGMCPIIGQVIIWNSSKPSNQPFVEPL